MHQRPVAVSTTPIFLWLNFTMQRSEKIVSISRALCFCGWSLSGMVAWLWSIHRHSIGRSSTYILVICSAVHALISTCTWRQFNFLDVQHDRFLNLNHSSISWRTTCTLGWSSLALQLFAGMCPFAQITFWVWLVFCRWWWPSPLSFWLWGGFVFGFSRLRPFAERECNNLVCWVSHMIRFARHSNYNASGLEGSSGRGAAGELAMFIENLYCLHHVQHDVLRSNTNGLNRLSTVLTQSATGCRMDWLQQSATAHKTIVRNWSCAVSVRSCQNGAQKNLVWFGCLFWKAKKPDRTGLLNTTCEYRMQGESWCDDGEYGWSLVWVAINTYASTMQLPNLVTMRMSCNVTNFCNNKSQIHFKLDTLFCNNILLHIAKYYLLDFTIPFLSITPLCLWGSVGYKHCCGIFTTLHKCKAHYSRVHSTLVPSVACQTTEVTLCRPPPFYTRGCAHLVLQVGLCILGILCLSCCEMMTCSWHRSMCNRSCT